MKIRSITTHHAFVPTLIFLALVVLLTVSLTLTDRPPQIHRIIPEIGTPGGVLVIEGANFGVERAGGEVVVAGVRPTTTSYLEWADSRISLQIPADVGTGLVRVRTKYGTSNGAVFTNRDLIPVVLARKSVPGVPYLERVEPEKGAVGSLLTITGLDFGLSRGEGSVLFSALPVGDDPDGAEQSVSASELDFDYESWTEQTVRVRVPDGASSGTIRIVTDRGESNELFFEVIRVGGTKSLRERRGFQIASTVTVDRVVADERSFVGLWIPVPLETYEQRDVETSRNFEAFPNEVQGVERIELSGFLPEMSRRIEHSWWLDRYALETSVAPARIVSEYDRQRRLFRVYTAADVFVPSDDEGIIAAAASAVARERNPYLAARAIYFFVLTQMTFDRKPGGKSVLDSFIAARGDSEDYALLFCALARSRGIPARPVAGVLVFDTSGTVRHVWAEFYIEGFGWVPVDPALGDGARFGDHPDLDTPEEYYFGTIDERRIAFTRGTVDITVPDETAYSGASRRFIDGVPSLQTAHEIVGRGVVSYRSVWSPIEVVDFW